MLESAWWYGAALANHEFTVEIHVPFEVSVDGQIGSTAHPSANACLCADDGTVVLSTGLARGPSGS